MAFFVFGAFMDRFASAVCALAQVHPGGDAGLLADVAALQVPLADGDIACGIETVGVVDDGPQVRQVWMAEVIERQVEVDAELGVPDEIYQDVPPSPLKALRLSR
ncbi:hypothetical protein OG819_32255 [Streptomyces sp. NBC_01549]|uniref:hypothetical protein n=1 Tax=Streptomyces sp. NBC_01549 TaxID=2975874 RepID=UPI00224EE73F|nr:hypothetical protein [Streptomyces sp. NBC_01549]